MTFFVVDVENAMDGFFNSLLARIIHEGRMARLSWRVQIGRSGEKA